jgi:hypothetical protein
VYFGLQFRAAKSFKLKRLLQSFDGFAVASVHGLFCLWAGFVFGPEDIPWRPARLHLKCTKRRMGPDWNWGPLSDSDASLLERTGDLRENAFERGSERVHCSDDCERDARRDQAVFDRGGTGLVGKEILDRTLHFYLHRNFGWTGTLVGMKTASLV